MKEKKYFNIYEDGYSYSPENDLMYTNYRFDDDLMEGLLEQLESTTLGKNYKKIKERNRKIDDILNDND